MMMLMSMLMLLIMPASGHDRTFMCCVFLSSLSVCLSFYMICESGKEEKEREGRCRSIFAHLALSPPPGRGDRGDRANSTFSFFLSPISALSGSLVVVAVPSFLFSLLL